MLYTKYHRELETSLLPSFTAPTISNFKSSGFTLIWGIDLSYQTAFYISFGIIIYDDLLIQEIGIDRWVWFVRQSIDI